jgi:hypothetical protein
MGSTTLSVDTYTSLTLEGIETSVFIGTDDDASLVSVEYWEDILENVICVHCLSGTDGPIVADIGDEEFGNGIDEVLNTIESLRDAADRLEAKLKERQVFLRDQWEFAKNVTTDPVEKSDFYVTFDEYMGERG